LPSSADLRKPELAGYSLEQFYYYYYYHYREEGQMLELIAQRGCGISSLGVTQPQLDVVLSKPL